MHAGATLAHRFTLLYQEEYDLPGVERWVGNDARLGTEVVVSVLTSLAPSHVRQAVSGTQLVRDKRFAKVIATGHEGEGPERTTFVVHARADGTALDTVLGERRMPPELAGAVIGDAARALAVAADGGESHGFMRPAALVVANTGHVVINGLGLDGELAAQAGRGTGRTQRADAVALARMYVLALTGKGADAAASSDLPEGLSEAQATLCAAASAGEAPETLEEVLEALGTFDTRLLKRFARKVASLPLVADAAQPAIKKPVVVAEQVVVAEPTVAAAAALAEEVAVAQHADAVVNEEIATGEILRPRSIAGPREDPESSLIAFEAIVEDQYRPHQPSILETLLERLHRTWPRSKVLTTAWERAHARALRVGKIKATPVIVAAFVLLLIVAVFVGIGLASAPPTFVPEPDPVISDTSPNYPDPSLAPDPSASPGPSESP